ncbi:hypothetical protein IW140_004242 [Coemansia sp. RSA 1813]|nr:hypothetical protein EV178_004591 [Coemansia sp. RSA 1646]KAJ1770490.1 hypothetical protein LPJ74_003162 [Coemansia sp. RSA 1843]KAJ2088152.1 hypothetical protein IW138_004414 [Coemansia sp. RSA 986]KAJ2212190.1 hypothetical protein EV179_004879 [Coemansia sp. RSA 487]KAJ2567997.1 hypothetical protein IW140_004242 [Coemansia sp. RSA 1813]
MRVLAIVSLLAASAVAMPTAHMMRRSPQQFPAGDMVNGPVALSNPDINNGAKEEGVLSDKTSFDGAFIDHPSDNTITDLNTNVNFHDNAILNPTINAAQNTVGGAVVGSDNEIIPLGGHGPASIAFRRRQSNVNAPTAIDNPDINNGAKEEGSLDADLSADGANVVNPVGNSLAQANANTEVSGNNFDHPTLNAIDHNNGPAMAGDNDIFMPVTNEAGAIQIDNGALMDAALMAGGYVPFEGI